MKKPNIKNMWEKAIRIPDGVWGENIKVLLEKVTPAISILKEKCGVQWYCFVIHNNKNGLPISYTGLQFHIRFENTNNLLKEDLSAILPYHCEMLLALIGSTKPNFVTVGQHYRNDILTIYEECPDGYMDDVHLRNRVEGCHRTEKRYYNLKEIEAKGIERVTTHLGMHLISILAVSLCKLQNGVSEGLTDTAGLI